MKQLFPLLLLLLVFSACHKTDNDDREVIIDPPFPRNITTDTLTSGEKWGLTIGDSPETLYAKIRQLPVATPVQYVNVVGNVFSRLSDIENKLPLYQSLFLDEAKGTSKGIQLSFNENRISAIYNNSGKAMNSWPLIPGSKRSVSKGDRVEDVYRKLQNISRMTAYAKLFERISIFTKEVKKEYDTGMSSSRQWYFVVPASGSNYHHIELHFEDRKLAMLVHRYLEY